MNLLFLEMELVIGYLGNSDLTNQKYISSPFSPNQKLYCTGDLAKFCNDGNLVFVGRNDHQVKVRGHRIELGEIETAITAYPGIEKSVVTLRNNNTTIVGFFVAETQINHHLLKEFLAKQLPFYSIPNFLIQLPKFPLTSNGKINKKQLDAIEVEVNHVIVAPQNECQQKLVTIWQELLQISPISIEDSFFDIGGDSLACIKLVAEIYGTFGVQLSVKDIFEANTIASLSLKLQSTTKTTNTTIVEATPQDSYPLSSAQKRVYYANHLDKDSLLYNIAGGIILEGDLDVTLLESCFQELIRRHEALRTFFMVKNNEVVQIIQNQLDFTLAVETCSTNVINDIYTSFVKPFDLSKAPLFRVKLNKLPDGKNLLLLDMHHIISDGMSLSILLQELCALYNHKTLSKKTIDYKDFTLWEQKQFSTKEFKQSQEFWKNEFQDEIPLLNMPTPFPRPTVQSFEGANYYTNLSTETFQKINTTAKKLNMTPYMLMLSVYYILLSKYTSQEDIVVGSAIVGREFPELSNVLGMFVNTLALRNKVESKLSFEEFGKNIKEHCFTCFAHQRYPFDMLVKDLELKRDTSRNPLFDVVFSFQNEGYPSISLASQKADYFIPDNPIAKFDLSLEIVPICHTYAMRFEYATHLFNEDFIKRFALHYENILTIILENPAIQIADIDMLSEAEKHQILQDFNHTNIDYPKTKTIVELFEKQVTICPNKVAIVFENQQLTYEQLNEKANQLAHLMARNSIVRGDIICLLLDKSLESVIAMLAVLKCGGTFLPLDVAYPKERIDYIIKNSNAKLLLTTQDFINKSNYTISSICIDLDNTLYSKFSGENLNLVCNAQDLAYIMYTSGSTGNPKGVMITNQNVVRLVKNNQFITFDKNERILQTGSIVFDACTFEIWGCLLNGYELHIITKMNLLNPVYLKNYIRDAKITSLFLTTQLFNQLCEADPLIFHTVKNLLTGGEAVSVNHINLVNEKNPELNVIHCYGPTENTTFSTCYDVEKIKYKNTVPIGIPISNSTTYVVSSFGKLCPIGVPGELWVGGDGVGKGYLNNPELTEEKFISNPFGDGKLYKTGDLVKWLPDGNIEFVGRIDNQVKIRGFRIELSEIDSKILEFPNIKYSITITNMIHNEKVICSYFVSDKKVPIPELKAYLQKCLPYFMIPSYFTQLENFSLNINGKIDTKCLPKDFQESKKVHPIEPPKTEMEKKIYPVFTKVLNTQDVSITDDLFKDLNGDSLTAMKIQIEALSVGLNIAYANIFKYPTIKTLASYLEKQEISATKKKDALDYSKYDSILANNQITDDLEILSTPVKNILLTGFTGFLGAHVLDSFIKKETGTIYCLIRNKNEMTALERLYNVLHFYFKDKYDHFIGNRIKLVEGDLVLDKFGLSEQEYDTLGKNISTVIHSAALVKHYGMYEEFEKANVLGTQQIVDFCKKFQLKLLHISTLSVSGNNFADGSNVENDFENDVDFSETNFYIGQNLESLYAKSKFEAERIVLEAICESGLEASILRMGNLTSRFSEGQFQQNHFENAFVNRFKSFLQIGYVPDYMLNLYAEFTPIDCCGDAIIEIAKHFNKNYTVFHLMNEKRVYLDRLFEMMKSLGLNMNIVPEDEFIQIINHLLSDDKTKMYIEGIINDFDKTNKHLVYESKVKVKCDFSKTYLEKLGFSWPYIDIDYMRNYFKYLEDIGYLNAN